MTFNSVGKNVGSVVFASVCKKGCDIGDSVRNIVDSVGPNVVGANVGSVSSKSAGMAESDTEGFSDGIEVSATKAFGSMQKSVLVMDIPEHPGTRISVDGFS